MLERYRNKISKIPIEYIIFAISFLVFWLMNNGANISYNNYSWLADSWLHGRLDTPDLPGYMERTEFMGKIYVHFAPGPAVVSLPFVALFGVGFRVQYLGFALGAGCAVLLYKTLANFNIGNKSSQLWITALGMFGTVFFFCAVKAWSWFFGQVTAFFFVQLALYLITCDKSKPFYTGMALGFATVCRMSSLFGIVFFIGYIILKKESIIKNILLLFAGMLPFGALYFIYNYVRFGTIMDISYDLVYFRDRHLPDLENLLALPPSEQLKEFYRLKSLYGGQLQIAHMASNLRDLFFLFPEFTTTYPYIIPSIFGVAFTFTSPALFAAIYTIPQLFFPKATNKPLIILLWGTLLITLLPSTMVTGNGFIQWGMRYSLDCTPYLLILTAFAMRPMKWWWRVAITYCIVINAYGVWYWNNFVPY